MLDKLLSELKDIEQHIFNSVESVKNVTNNHNILLGAKAMLQKLIQDSEKVTSVIAPESKFNSALKVVDDVLNAIPDPKE